MSFSLYSNAVVFELVIAKLQGPEPQTYETGEFSQSPPKQDWSFVFSSLAKI